MPTRRWEIDISLIIVVILCVGTVGYVAIDNAYLKGRQDGSQYSESGENADYAKRHIDEVCLGLTGAEWIKCAIYAMEPYQQKSQDTRDLHAQEWMAHWAKLMFFAAAASTLVAAYGLILLRRTWHETKRTADISKEIGRDQARAYVDVGAVNFYWGTEVGDHPRVSLSLRNSGATPAKWFQVRQSYLVYEHAVGWMVDSFSNLKLSSEFGGKWNGIAGGEKDLTVTGPAIHDWRSVAQCRMEVATHLKTPSPNTHGIVVFGEVRYCTVFDEIYLSQFVFGAGSLRAFRSEEPIETNRREIAPGVTSVNRRLVEIPQKLSKFPMDLHLHKKLCGDD